MIVWPVGVVAPRDLADPVDRIARHGGYGGRRHATGQQPEEVPMAALDRIMCPVIAVVEFVVGQMGCEADVSWHAPVLQLHAATPYEQQLLQAQAVQSCQEQVHQKWDTLIQSAQVQELPTAGSLAEEQAQLNACQ
jgi:hypothetical protein